MTQKKMRNRFAHNLRKELGITFIEANRIASRVGKLVYLDKVDPAGKVLKELVLDYWYKLKDLAPLAGVTADDLDEWEKLNEF
jgi:hypothetical protein